MLKESIKKVRGSVVRIIITLNNGNVVSGTGFFIQKNKLLTCAHVAFGSDGTDFEKSLVLIADNEKVVRENFKQRVKSIKIFAEDKTDLGEAEITYFDIKNDAAILTSLKETTKISPIVLNHEILPTLGEKVAFCGFPQANDSKDPLTYSFMLNEGIISGLPENGVGGFPIYEHFQINAISLGGFSGSPLFLEETGEIVGLINGNASTGITAALVIPNNNTVQNTNYLIPLGIGYATSLKRFSDIILRK